MSLPLAMAKAFLGGAGGFIALRTISNQLARETVQRGAQGVQRASHVAERSHHHPLGLAMDENEHMIMSDIVGWRS
ncbi:hypothetical protein CALVIDRAFT_539973 [Calocera viscosa TUFC12733]|uniref:Uncharacterized protein n=1 Tax=Calocera viscosa (strain TUFC12733) TaxID=1330018 RepID=A0A167JET0_CALVF|nr:hypothetical protein CALVIDRAFT_539973 [Calocera viscosa TUFC12733]